MRLVGELVVGQRVAEPCGDRQQRVEPAAGLIDAFGDEVGGVIPLELVPVLEREVPLGERHRSGVEPGIDNLGASLHDAAALAFQLVAVDERLVRIEVVRQLHARPLGQLGVAANRLDVGVVLLADPERQRRPPVPVARNGPVDVVRQPLSESTSTDFGGMPVDTCVADEHRVLELSGAYEPGGAGVIEERRLTTPAMRIGVLELSRLPEHAATFQLLENYRIGILIFREVALEIACFHRATAGEILRIEIKHHPFAAIVFQAHLRAIARGKTKIRRRSSRLRLILRLRSLHERQCN